jgi:cell wall assembly regulator SMI1
MTKTEDHPEQVRVVKSLAATTRARIEQVESALGRRFPDEYVEFLLAHNGGFPKPSGVRLPGRATATETVSWFLGIDGKENLDLMVHARSYCGSLVPPDLLPIAFDPGGNLFLLNVGDGAERGHVYFWNHEGGRIRDIFPSLDAFLSSFSD